MVNIIAVITIAFVVLAIVCVAGLLLLGKRPCQRNCVQTSVTLSWYVSMWYYFSAFYVSFVVTPLCSNASELVSSLVFASKKKKENVSMTFSQVSSLWRIGVNKLIWLTDHASAWLCRQHTTMRELMPTTYRPCVWLYRPHTDRCKGYCLVCLAYCFVNQSYEISRLAGVLPKNAHAHNPALYFQQWPTVFFLFPASCTERVPWTTPFAWPSSVLWSTFGTWSGTTPQVGEPGRHRKYVFDVTSGGQRNSVKVEAKFHLECKLRFPCAQFMLR